MVSLYLVLECELRSQKQMQNKCLNCMWCDQAVTLPYACPRYILSDELDPSALRLGPEFNDISAAGASALDTLLIGRCDLPLHACWGSGCLLAACGVA